MCNGIFYCDSLCHRSKELEAGGGAAALQGVGIQAVVTECLICYCDIIFSDKMPTYGLQDGLSEFYVELRLN